MPVQSSTAPGSRPPVDAGNLTIAEQPGPQTEARHATQTGPADTWEDAVCRDDMSYGAAGYSNHRSNSPSPKTGTTDIVEPAPREPSTVGVELSVSAQVFLGVSLKAAILTDSTGQTGVSFTVAGRAGWAFGASAEAAGVYAPGQGVDKMGGMSMGAQVEAGLASAGVSKNVGNHGPAGPPTYTVSPPGAGVGLMVGVTSEVELTAVVTGPKTPEEADAMLKSLN